MKQERAQDMMYRLFFRASWGCWDMKMPFWGKLIACSATKSKIPLFSELQFPEVHCSSKAVITMQHVLKEHHYTFHEEKGNLSIAAPWLKKKDLKHLEHDFVCFMNINLSSYLFLK